MTIQTIIWNPDTCNCSVLINYDDTQTNPVYNLTTYIFKDTPHAGLDDSDAFNVIINENSVKAGVVLYTQAYTMEQFGVKLNFNSGTIAFQQSGYSYGFQYSGIAVANLQDIRPLDVWVGNASGSPQANGGLIQSGLNSTNLATEGFAGSLSGIVFVVSGAPI